MNRAWMIRAEQRIAQLEAAVRALKEAQAREVVTADVPVQFVVEPVKRGPGRPRKVESVEAV
jgi:hypothetical protein